ncbi:hypothetical protein DCAR_0624976 [Daucus carota subsp. sativus]|uniref:RING-type E3 ubiquitin transferase n=1 Tax=Daucus carota subsp. sativus TaxID=79200 RepID=A0AAF1B6B8_DAUCS|nr:hypothetical protein DCAR_0624976 [Daucus carota subsp. sativus]
MTLVHSLLFIWISVIVSFTVTSSFSYSDTYEEHDDATNICKLTRSVQLERECRPVLSSVVSKSDLGSDKFYRIARDISFQNGDWTQEPKGSPLMPFDDTDMPNYNISAFESLLKLASFYIMGIDFAHQSDTAVGLCGLLSIGITRNRTMSYAPQKWSPWFHKSPGYSDLTILFEGLYVESQETGERLMCLLGTSLFPYSDIYANSYEYWVQHHSCKMDQSSNLDNDQIMLVLRYPQNFSLTNRAIIGEMRSLHRKSDAMYFDNVHISSMMGHDTKYQFSSEELVASACKDSSCHDTLVDENIHISKGFQFCDVFQRFANSEAFDIVVINSNCHSKSCNKLGPFVLERNLEGTNQTLDDFKLIVSNYRCVLGNNNSKRQKSAKVFAVFRALSSQENRHTSQSRSGLSGMTISAEGTWDASTGHLCMIGCVGIEKGSDECNSRICIYFPKTFSITQRKIFIGTISSMSNIDPYASLTFKKELRPKDLWNYYNEYTKSYLVYKYSKIELATKLLKRNKNLLYETFVKKFLILRYPSVKDQNNMTSLSLVSGELGFSTKVLPKILYRGSPLEQVVQLEVLTLGPMFGYYWEHQKVQTCEVKAADSNETSAFTEDEVHLNISAQLSLTGKPYSHVAELLVEGLYDPFEGKMHLIGCRSVPKFLKFGKENLTLENDMDCLIEVKVEYTSKTTRWLVNPTVKVSIVSQRAETTPLYFSPISLKSALITYRDNFSEVTFRQNFEFILRMVALLSSIAIVLRQLYYVDQKVDAVHFISLVMLGIQITGYTLPLVMNTEILFKWKAYQYPESRIINSGKSLWVERLDCALKCLVLVAFTLTFRLFQKVWDSLKVPRKSLSWKKIPSETKPFLLTFLVHIFGFLEAPQTLRTYGKVPEWANDLEKYMAIVQDLFLLPQAMGNLQWQKHGKPLSKVYYIGFSVLRFVIRGYDYIRDPIFSWHFHKYDSVTSSVIFTKSENCVIMVIVVALAIIVHVQQSHLKI